jgi:hypothetical protein
VTSGVARACAEAALRAGREIRELVHAMPPGERGRPTRSLLKPKGGYGARVVDARAEEVGIARLEGLATDLGVAIELLVEPGALAHHRLGRADGPAIWAAMDAIDGTVKVAGLGSAHADRVRLGNDGGWAAAFAFTSPTTEPADALRLGDFVVAVVVDGNPPRWPTYPQDLVALPSDDGPVTLEVVDGRERRVFTTSSEDLGQLWVSLDVFQAYDLATRAPGDVELGVELYRRLTDRHGGGAFDVLRQYANLSALARLLFGWRELPVWIESQGGAFVVVNENLPNLRRPLAARHLASGRTSIVHAANDAVCRRILEHIAAARDRLGCAG